MGARNNVICAWESTVVSNKVLRQERRRPGDPNVHCHSLVLDARGGHRYTHLYNYKQCTLGIKGCRMPSEVRQEQPNVIEGIFRILHASRVRPVCTRVDDALGPAKRDAHTKTTVVVTWQRPIDQRVKTGCAPVRIARSATHFSLLMPNPPKHRKSCVLLLPAVGARLPLPQSSQDCETATLGLHRPPSTTIIDVLVFMLFRLR